MTSLDLSTQSPAAPAVKSKSVPLNMRLIRLFFSKIGPVFPKTFGNLAYRLWFSTRPKPKNAAEQAFIASADKIYHLDIVGKQVPVYIWENEGPTLLLLHGWEGRTGQFGPIAQPLLKAGFRIVGFDAPGHGNAEGSRTNLDEIHEAITIIRQREAGISGIIAHSFGAISTTFAMVHGLKPERVVLVSAPSGYDHVVRTFQSMLTLPETVVNAMVEKTRRNFAHWPRPMEEMMDVDHNAPSFECPALIIHDRGDKIVSLDQGERIAAAWPDSELMVTQGLGHSKILQNPQVIDRIAAYFT